MEFSLSPLEEARFGVRTVRTQVGSVEDIQEVLRFCHASEVRLAISRCPVEPPLLAQQLEEAGFRLMDTLVTYERTLLGLPEPPSVDGIAIQVMHPEDTPGIVEIARECFRDYAGHYHADARLDRAACEEIYPSWTRRCCENRDASHEVFTAYVEGIPVGFAAVELESDAAARVPLNAVRPEFRRRGIYTALLSSAVHWSRTRQASSLRISTQLNNLGVQSAWTKLGFTLCRAEYTFHRWFD